MSIYRSAESVSPKHPDKLCDQISDAILDAYVAQDPDARTAIETVGSHGKVLVTGEVTSTAAVDIPAIVARLAGDVSLDVHISQQSPEIAHGVDSGGAGDQGIMVGYACGETPDALPLEVVLSRRLNQFLYKQWPYDGKTQVTLRDGQLVSVVASFQLAPRTKLEKAVQEWIADEDLVTVPEDGLTIHANPAGDWQQGGFDADAGLTGRKLVVDNYGPRVPIGGGCFSGKDPSKVDRSAAYMARKIALDYLRRRDAREVYCYLAYAIGFDQPLEASVIVDGRQEVVSGYDLSPRGIADQLALKQPHYEKTARYGHFGHAGFPWEN